VVATSETKVDVSVDDDGTIHLGPRTIPLPRSISEEARRSLAIPRAPQRTVPPLDDKEGWRQLVARVNATFLPAVDRALKRTDGRATVETTTVAGVTVHVATPTDATEANRERAWITIHGGGFIFLAGPWARAEAGMTAAEWQCVTYGIDHRNPPDDPFPAAVDDVVAVYRELLERYEPRNIVISGASAGGNIASAGILKARDEGLPLPGVLILDTPLTDATQSGDTFQTMRQIDAKAPELPMEPTLLYAGDHDLAHPYLSPIFADFNAGFPPTYIQSGTRDLLLSSSVQMHRALRNAEIDAELHIWEGAPHSAFLLTGAPEEAEAHAERARFLAKHWGTGQRG
jgi:monoterpene epsilon-lactone hydrolase